MKAIVTRKDKDGYYDEVGMNNRTVVGPYKTERGLLRYGMPSHFKGELRVEIFYSDSILQEKADKTVYVFNQ